MLHHRQNSIGPFGAFAFTIAAVDIAARADAHANDHGTGETEPAAYTVSNGKTLFGLMRDFAVSIIRPQRVQPNWRLSITEPKATEGRRVTDSSLRSKDFENVLSTLSDTAPLA